MWTKLASSLTILTLVHLASASGYGPSMTSSYSSQESPPPSPEARPAKSAHLLAELILKNDCFANLENLQAISVCLKTKLLVNLNELVRSNRTVEISSFHFVKTKPLSDLDNRVEENLNEIPDEERSLDNESSRLTHLILKRVGQFFQTRSVRTNMESNDDSGVDDEGRKKKDKGGMMMMMAMGMGGMMMQMMMGKVAMIAMKALVIGKIALILAGILALKKLMQQGGGGGNSHGSSSHGSSDWSSRRIYLDDTSLTSPTDMAYRAYAPTLVTRK